MTINEDILMYKNIRKLRKFLEAKNLLPDNISGSFHNEDLSKHNFGYVDSVVNNYFSENGVELNPEALNTVFKKNSFDKGSAYINYIGKTFLQKLQDDVEYSRICSNIYIDPETNLVRLSFTGSEKDEIDIRNCIERIKSCETKLVVNKDDEVSKQERIKCLLDLYAKTGLLWQAITKGCYSQGKARSNSSFNNSSLQEIIQISLLTKRLDIDNIDDLTLEKINKFLNRKKEVIQSEWEPFFSKWKGGFEACINSRDAFKEVLENEVVYPDADKRPSFGNFEDYYIVHAYSPDSNENSDNKTLKEMAKHIDKNIEAILDKSDVYLVKKGSNVAEFNKKRSDAVSGGDNDKKEYIDFLAKNRNSFIGISLKEPEGGSLNIKWHPCLGDGVCNEVYFKAAESKKDFGKGTQYICFKIRNETNPNLKLSEDITKWQPQDGGFYVVALAVRPNGKDSSRMELRQATITKNNNVNLENVALGSASVPISVFAGPVGTLKNYNDNAKKSYYFGWAMDFISFLQGTFNEKDKSQSSIECEGRIYYPYTDGDKGYYTELMERAKNGESLCFKIGDFGVRILSKIISYSSGLKFSPKQIDDEEILVAPYVKVY